MKALFVSIVVVVFVAVGAMLYGINCPNKLIESTSIVLQKGESVRSLAQNLKTAGVINSPLLFRIVVRALKVDKRLKAGEYMFAPHMNMLQVAGQLLRGEVFYRRVTIAEGLTSAQIRTILNNEPYLSGDISVDMPEGSMLPETYTFSRHEERQKLVNQAKQALDKVLSQAWEDRDADLPLKNKEEMLILASIVEKETGVADERPQVASVFVNRLKKGMLLQTDPTVIYALTEGKSDLKRSLTRKDLEIDSPYNTYKYAGLPPTPICNPGKAAIEAVAHPDKTPYLYFVASGNGGHNFARTLEEHNLNVRKWKAAAK
jgi:UPF0755 protein